MAQWINLPWHDTNDYTHIVDLQLQWSWVLQQAGRENIANFRFTVESV